MADKNLPPKVVTREFRKIRSKPVNRSCFDCPTRNPTWASVPFGVLLCVDCAAIHRRMGVHISFVRSTVLDKWNPEQLMCMMAGGNDKAHAYFKQHGWVDEGADKRTAKFTSRAATQYKAHLEKEKQALRATALPVLLGENGDEKPAAKPVLLSGDDGLEALTQSLSANKIKQSRSLDSLSTSRPASAKPTPKPKPAEKKELPSNLASKVKEEEAKPVRRVIKKKTEETTKVSLSGKPKSKGRDGLAMQLSTKRATSARSRPKLEVLAGVEDDFDAQFAKLSAEQANQAKESKEAAEQRKKDELQAKADARKKASAARYASNDDEDDGRLSKYANAKCISSDMYFERGDYQIDEQDRARMEQFSNANAIGSDAYFGREEEEHGGGSGLQDFADIKYTAAQKGREMASMASGLFNSIKSRYAGT